MKYTEIEARSLVVGDVFKNGLKVTRVTRGPGTFHTAVETSDGTVEVLSDAETVTVAI